MLAWLSAYWGTLLVSALLIGIIAAILTGMIRDKKKGRSSCGCGCEHCAMSEECHKTETRP